MSYVPAEPQPTPTPSPPPVPVVGTIPVGPRSPLLMGAVAAVMFVAGIANALLYNVSPGGPVEAVLAYGTGISLVMSAVAITIVAISLSRGGNAPTLAKSAIDPLAITSVSLGGLALIVWAALGGGYFLVRAFTGSAFRYMEDVNGAFFAGIPWMGAIIFGVIAYRQGRGTSNVLALIGIGIGILLLIPTLASGIIYGLHLSP